MAFSMTYQPSSYDSPITTVWDLAQFNVVMQGGIVQSGMMTFNCYTQAANIGDNTKIIDQHSFQLTAADVSAFQTANNLQPDQIAQLAYGLAQSIQDVVVTAASDNTPAGGNTPAVMANFFAGASIV